MNNNSHKKIRAFTLIELLVVIAIVGILSGLIVMTASNATNAANDAKRKANLETIRKALLMYQANNGGVYPISTVQCDIGSTCTTTEFNSLIANYLPNPPRDPAGTFYKYYSYNGSSFDISASLSTTKQFSVSLSGQACPVNWIDSGHGFCVMQYEARKSGGMAVSMTGGAFYNLVSQAESITACNSLGNGTHLITNAEWILLARDIEGVDANWSGGKVGSGKIKIGNTLYSTEDSVAYNLNAMDSGNTNPLATLYLDSSLAKPIYHFAGNLWEWTNDVLETSQLPGYSASWKQIDSIDTWSSGLNYNMVGPINSKYANYSYGTGKILFAGGNSHDGSTTHTFVRGGDWGFGLGAGIYSLNFLYSPNETGMYGFGFRCVR